MMSDAVETPPPTTASMDSIDPHTPTKSEGASSTLSSRVNKKYLKLGVVGLAVVALIIGLSVGLTNKNKAANNVSASNVESMFDVFGDEAEDCAGGFGGGKSGKGSKSGSVMSSESDSGSKGSKSGSGSSKAEKDSSSKAEKDSSSKASKESDSKSGKGSKSSSGINDGCSNLPDICEESGFGPSDSKSSKSGSSSSKSDKESGSGSSKSDKESGSGSSKSDKESGSGSSKSDKESGSKSGKGSKSEGGNLIPTICSPTPTPPSGGTPPSGEISTLAPTYASSNVGTPENSIAGTPGSTPTVATESEYAGSEQTGSRGPDVP